MVSVISKWVRCPMALYQLGRPRIPSSKCNGRICEIVVEQFVLQGAECGKAARSVLGGAFPVRGMSTRPRCFLFL
jgi:hypothetical protein